MMHGLPPVAGGYHGKFGDRHEFLGSEIRCLSPNCAPPLLNFSRFIVHFMLLTEVPKAMIEPHGRAALYPSAIVWRPGLSAPPCGRNWFYDFALAQQLD